MKPTQWTLAAAAIVALAIGLGCNDLTLANKGDTQATWENFGQTFFANYCVRCHRSGGSEFALESLEQVYKHRDAIKSAAGAGNYSMPTDYPRPSAEERQRLSDWIDADCPSDGGSGGDDSGGDDSAATDLTWGNFAQPFMQDFCTRCHAAGGSQFALETYDQVYARRGGVKSTAGTGTSMPIGDPKPSGAQRADLVEWIDAGCPQ
jgi:uncharacterized membrane protein